MVLVWVQEHLYLRCSECFRNELGFPQLISPYANLACNSISEISPPSKRGMLMSGYQAILQLCALVGFWGAYASNAIFSSTSSLQWQIPVAVQLIPGIFRLLHELDEIREASLINERLSLTKTPFLREVMKKGVRQRLVVGVGLMIAQNMVGLNALNYCKFCIDVYSVLLTCTDCLY
jgi:hypothetical protein